MHAKKLKNQEKYPSKNKAVAMFDRLIIVVGVGGAIATLPQVIQIWSTQDATGVSLISWSYYLFSASMFLIYGLIHRAIPIIINYGAALFLYFLIVLGTAIYG